LSTIAKAKAGGHNASWGACSPRRDLGIYRVFISPVYQTFWKNKISFEQNLIYDVEIFFGKIFIFENETQRGGEKKYCFGQ